MPIAEWLLANVLPHAVTMAGNALGSYLGSRSQSQSAGNTQGSNTQGQGNFFTGTPGSLQQVSAYTPQQEQLWNQLLPLLSQKFQNNKFDFAPIAQKARTNFERNTIPSIAERFTAMGPGAQRSASFQAAIGGAGKDLEESLAALESGYNLQQENSLQQLLGLLLKPRYDHAYLAGTPGVAQPLLEGLGSSFPYLAQALQQYYANQQTQKKVVQGE